MSFYTQRTTPDYSTCTGRPAACCRIGVNVAKPRAKGRLIMQGSRSTRVSAMRISWRAVASRLPNSAESWLDMTRRTTMRGIPSKLRYQT